MANVNQLYERLRGLPFPVLGKQVGDFPLYDALLAGCADRVARGGRMEASEIPVPDEHTAKHVDLLRKKNHLTEEERAFLRYYDVLELIRLALGP